MTAPLSAIDPHNSTEFDTFDTESDLSTVQQQVVAALARGRTLTAAAAEVQLHRSTIHNWLNTLPAILG
jgi:hypothetical protein